MTREDKIRDLLVARLGASLVEIENDDARHAGHPEARGGGGHFEVLVVATSFEGLSRVERHRAVYAALAEMMPTEIHAIGVRAMTPTETSSTP